MIDRLGTLIYESIAMLSGMQLDIFTHLSGFASTATELADQMRVDAYKLTPRLYALTAVGLLKVEDDRFTNGQEG